MLRRGGETKYWIVPNRFPEKTGEKRIAVEEELYKETETGEKPSVTARDRYGTGSSRLWDSGECEILESKKYKLVIKAHGEKLRGNYLFFIPGWGRWTKRRLWVVEKIRGNS